MPRQLQNEIPKSVQSQFKSGSGLPDVLPASPMVPQGAKINPQVAEGVALEDSPHLRRGSQAWVDFLTMLCWICILRQASPLPPAPTKSLPNSSTCEPQFQHVFLNKNLQHLRKRIPTGPPLESEIWQNRANMPSRQQHQNKLQTYVRNNSKAEAQHLQNQAIRLKRLHILSLTAFAKKYAPSAQNGPCADPKLQKNAWKPAKKDAWNKNKNGRQHKSQQKRVLKINPK